MQGAATSRKAPGGYFWSAAAVRELLRLGRRGDPWQSIGLAFYPDKDAVLAAKAAAEAFRRHAREYDREIRAEAIRRHNWNKPRGHGRHAIKRRANRELNGLPLPPATERINPFVGLGQCFA